MTSQIQMINEKQNYTEIATSGAGMTRETECIDQKHTILRRFTEPSAPLCWVWTFSKFIIEYLSTRSTLNSFRKCPENPCWLIFWRPLREHLLPIGLKLHSNGDLDDTNDALKISSRIICQCSGPKVSEVWTSGDTCIGGDEQCSGRTRGCAQLSCRMRSWY